MPRGRIKGDHNAKRIQIAEAACKVFLRRGLTRTSLADIAAEMGYTTGVLRHYFSDKDELLLYAKNLLFDRTHRRAGLACAEHTGLNRLREMAAELLPGSREAIDSYRLLAMFNGNAVGDARLMKLQHRRNDTHATLFAEVITELQKNGDLPKHLNPKLEASAILALVDGLAEQQIVRPQPWTLELLRSLLFRHVDTVALSRQALGRNA